jgi:quercetin 2,3-dioxygenase
MSLVLRKSHERGHANFGWLDSRHSFSFGEYYDPAHMGFGPLRVINDDHVAAGAGFPMHGHNDMEIISYVLDGALEHKDSLGTGSIIRADDVQRMSAGTGIKHSEFNPSQKEDVHFLQIWIMPHSRGLTPSYEQKNFARPSKENQWRLIASGDGRDGSLTIHRDVNVYASIITPTHTLRYDLAPAHQAWLQLARGTLSVNGIKLGAGDGLAIEHETELHIDGQSEEAEFILFDMV